MDKLPITHRYLPKLVLTALILEILASLIFFMISKTWINQIIYVPVGQYVPPIMKVNINRLLTHNNQMQLISPQIRENISQLPKGMSQKYHNIYRPQNVYYPGDPLPEKQLDAIRNSSDTKLKRRLTYKTYEVLRNMLAEVVQIFAKNDIRYTLTRWHFHKLFKW